MNVWLLDTEKFIKVNALKEVTNPMNLDRGNIPTEDGIFSTTIFGTSSSERKVNYAYIDLHKHFLNPKVYISLKRLNRNFESVVYGSKKFIIDSKGQLVQDDNGDTGIDWLYKNWEKLKFNKNDSAQRGERVDVMLKNPKNVLFMKYQIVIPAFYRDINLQSAGKPSFIELNNIYAKLLRSVSVIRNADTFDFMLNATSGKIQDLIVEIYDTIKKKISGKNGYIRKFLMGRSVDYSSRLVITAVPYDNKSMKDQPVDYYSTGVPLAYACGMFTPFIIYWVKRFFERELEPFKNNYPIKLKSSDDEIKYIRLKDPNVVFNEDYITKRLNLYIKTPSSRFDVIELPIEDGEIERLKLPKDFSPKMKFVGKLQNQQSGDLPDRYLTWTDIFYMAAVDVTSDKHIYITRYPMLDYLGTYTSRIHILSTRKTTPVIVNDTLYKYYPLVETNHSKDENIDILFRDTLSISALYLPGMDGDFDGDQTTIKGVFSQEANEECERILHSKSNLMAIDGRTIRVIGNEGIQTLYSMTLFK